MIKFEELERLLPDELESIKKDEIKKAWKHLEPVAIPLMIIGQPSKLDRARMITGRFIKDFGIGAIPVIVATGNPWFALAGGLITGTTGATIKANKEKRKLEGKETKGFVFYIVDIIFKLYCKIKGIKN